MWIVDPNPNPVPRRALIAVGANRITLTQEAARKIGWAAAPSKLEFIFEEKKRPDSKKLTVWTEDSGLTYTISSGEKSWLVVKLETRDNAAKRQRINVEIDPERLAPGRYEETIQIMADGIAARPIAIPVVVVVQPRK
jgi:hypothetical protein